MYGTSVTKCLFDWCNLKKNAGLPETEAVNTTTEDIYSCLRPRLYFLAPFIESAGIFFGRVAVE